MVDSTLPSEIIYNAFDNGPHLRDIFSNQVVRSKIEEIMVDIRAGTVAPMRYTAPIPSRSGSSHTIRILLRTAMKDLCTVVPKSYNPNLTYEDAQLLLNMPYEMMDGIEHLTAELMHEMIEEGVDPLDVYDHIKASLSRHSELINAVTRRLFANPGNNTDPISVPLFELYKRLIESMVILGSEGYTQVAKASDRSNLAGYFNSAIGYELTATASYFQSNTAVPNPNFPREEVDKLLLTEFARQKVFFEGIHNKRIEKIEKAKEELWMAERAAKIEREEEEEVRLAEAIWAKEAIRKAFERDNMAEDETTKIERKAAKYQAMRDRIIEEVREEAALAAREAEEIMAASVTTPKAEETPDPAKVASLEKSVMAGYSKHYPILLKHFNDQGTLVQASLTKHSPEFREWIEEARSLYTLGGSKLEPIIAIYKQPGFYVRALSWHFHETANRNYISLMNPKGTHTPKLIIKWVDSQELDGLPDKKRRAEVLDILQARYDSLY